MSPDTPLPATTLVPELAAFRVDLEDLGYVVVPHGDHLCVRLPQFALTGVGALSLGAAFVGVMLAARDVGRYVVTEGCITRLQLLWAARSGPPLPASAPTRTLGVHRTPTPTAGMREP